MGKMAKASYIPLLQIKGNPGVSNVNMITFFFASFISICCLVFVGGAMSYVLTAYLEVPQENQGDVLGTVTLADEVATLVTIAIWGVASDKFSRRVCYAAGCVIVTISFILFSFSRTLELLLFSRIVFAFGASALTSMLTALVADYPKNSSRGKAGGVIGLLAGAGALVALFLFLKIPLWLTKYFPSTTYNTTTVNNNNINNNNDGSNNNFNNSTSNATLTTGTVASVISGQIMFWIIGFFYIISAVLLFLGLSKKDPVKKPETFWGIVKTGFFASKRPRVILSYMASFATRGIVVCLTSTLTLWVNKYEILKGSTAEEAVARASTVSGIAQTLTIVGAPFFGILGDKVDRVIFQGISSIISVIAFFFTFSISKPEGGIIYGACALVGLAEIANVISSQVLVASACPEEVRGAVSGYFGLVGSIGIIITAKLGGYLFDTWKETAPFLLVGIWSLVTLIGCIIVYIIERKFGVPEEELQRKNKKKKGDEEEGGGEGKDYKAVEIEGGGEESSKQEEKVGNGKESQKSSTSQSNNGKEKSTSSQNSKNGKESSNQDSDEDDEESDKDSENSDEDDDKDEESEKEESTTNNESDDKDQEEEDDSDGDEDDEDEASSN